MQPLVFLGVSLLWLAFVRRLLPFTARADNPSEVIVAVCNAGTFGCAAALALKKDATADLTCAESLPCCDNVPVSRSSFQDGLLQSKVGTMALEELMLHISEALLC